MNYAPRGLYVWDAWYMTLGGHVHAYHLQRRRPGADVSDMVHNSFGHAVTSNLVDWEQRGVAFGPDATDPIDNHQPWTGCALWHEGRGYLFYTMRSLEDGGRIQRIGLARTTDPDRWERYAHNPVIEPDPRWYADAQRPVPGVVDCRDLIVVGDPTGKGWFGFYATRQPGRELPQTSVIACVYSTDLIHWEHRPPAFAPEKYACLEVPDVFELDGRWYLTCLTGHLYGNRGIWSDPNVVGGTMYAVASRPEGPYVELDDNVLIAARSTFPISSRTVAFEGERHLLYTDCERTNHTDKGGITFGSLSTPKTLGTDGDRLIARYSPRIESHVTGEPIGPDCPPHPSNDNTVRGQLWQMPSASWKWSGSWITGSCRSGWGIAPLDIAADSFIWEATIVLGHQTAAAGLMLRMKTKTVLSMKSPADGCVVALDAKDQTVIFAEVPLFDFIEKRQTRIPTGRPIHLRVVNRLEHVEVYVDDDLRLAFSRYCGLGGTVGLFVDRGDARFSGLRLRILDVVNVNREIRGLPGEVQVRRPVDLP